MDRRPIPEAAERDSDAVEIISAWIASRGLHCSMKIGLYQDRDDIDERRAWGIVLADIARHAARGLSDFYHFDEDEALSRITDSMKGELAEPTSPIRGKLGGR
jgi:hypothetical protein